MSGDTHNMIGNTIGGRFTVTEFLGEGGMGVVYKGTHQPLGTQVAIKVLKKEHASDDRMVARFRREVRSTTHVQHRNVVQIFDSGQLPDGRLYLVMEFIQGQTMNELLDDLDAMPVERAIRFLLQIADGMAAAHKHNIMHRDLKPENILNISSPEGDVVKILDFGLARMVESDNTEDKITMAGEVFGTPDYMSPEQCLGGELDLTTDVYSFGVLAFEALTGECPFEANNIVALMLAHKNKKPPVPSEFYPEAKIPKELDNLILKCLAKAPSDRFANGMELAQELRRIYNLHVSDAAGAPADLKIERRLPSIELTSIGSGASLTPGEVSSMVQERLRDRLRRVAEHLRNQNALSPGIAVNMAHLTTQEGVILKQRQAENSIISKNLEEEANLQRRTAQLRIAVQDLSYDRELLARSLAHNPAITAKELKAIFPYLDDSAPVTGKELMEDVSFQITSLERSIKESQDAFEETRGGMRRELELQRQRTRDQEKILQEMVYGLVEELLSDNYAQYRQDPTLEREFTTLNIFYQEAIRFSE